MGGLPWDVAARDLPVPEAISQRRAALGIPQATPRAQEAPPQAAKRGQGQACGDGQTAPDTQDQSTKTSKSVYNIISTQGWVNPGEVLIKVVIRNKPKMLSGLNQKGTWSGAGAPSSPVADVAPPADKHDLTPGSIEKVNEVTPLSPCEGRLPAKEANETAGEGMREEANAAL